MKVIKEHVNNIIGTGLKFAGRSSHTLDAPRVVMYQAAGVRFSLRDERSPFHVDVRCHSSIVVFSIAGAWRQFTLVRRHGCSFQCPSAKDCKYSRFQSVGNLKRQRQGGWVRTAPQLSNLSFVCEAASSGSYDDHTVSRRMKKFIIKKYFYLIELKFPLCITTHIAKKT
jgi:hypothetical protein